MTRSLNQPTVSEKDYVLSVLKGGTGSSSVVGAAAALDIVTNAQRNVPGGVVSLDAQGKMAASVITSGGIVSSEINLTGTLDAFVSLSKVFTITDFDSFKTYNVSVSAGTVSRSGATITFTPPVSEQTVTLTVNGRSFNIVVTVPPVAQPFLEVVETPTGSTSTLTCTGSDFFRPFTSDTHLNSDWQLATDAGFTNIVSQSMADAVSLKVRAFTGVALNTSYRVRVRYRSSSGIVSDWSATSTITTRLPDTQSPTLSVVETPTGSTTSTLTYTGSVFNRPLTSDTHLNSDWQLATDAGFTNIVSQSMADAVNLRTRSFTGLARSTTYRTRVRYRSSTGSVSDWSATSTFTTSAAADTQTPTILSVNAGENSLTYSSSAFSRPGTSDTHQSTDWQAAVDINFNTVISQSLGNTTNLTSITLSGLQRGTSYHSRVRYRSSSGNVSNWSATVNTNTTSPPR